jgi:hypothetical protein
MSTLNNLGIWSHLDKPLKIVALQTPVAKRRF